MPARPSPPAGAYRFAPDPVQKSESEKQKERKERKGKKIGGQMLSFARGEVGKQKAIHNLYVMYDIRGFDSSNELLCTKCFQNRIGQ